jgi:peptidyl-prolyl cis-trans isomerase D
MLQDIRKYTQGTTAKIVVGLIVISFAFFGIESILVNGGGNEIAEVNGEPIQPQELQQALDTQKRRLMAMMGENLDPAILDDDRLRPQALEALINRKLLMQSASAMKLVVSEREIGTVVGSMEQFQVDGAFSPEAYKSVLASAGYTPAYFKQSLRDDMLLSQLRSGLAGSEFVTPSELELNTRVIAEQRDLRYFTIPIEKYAPTATSPVTEVQIENYYDAHQEDFRSLESVDVDYLELALDDFRQPVDESAIREAYELGKQEAQFKTQNRVSHILFESGAENNVKERIEQAQAKLTAGVAFADVAKEFSQDVGSADKGGDLGYSSGDTFPASMEVAIEKLEPGVVSSPVETEAGTHLILVTERKKGEPPTLEDMRQQLQEKIQSDEARVVLLRSVETLKDLAFNAEDLSYPAKQLNLVVKQADAVTRTQNQGLFSNPTVMEAVFSEEVMSSGNNSEVIELEGNKFVVLHVRKHNVPEVKPLLSVRDEVVRAVTAAEARAAISADADSVLAQLRAGLAMDKFASSHGYPLQVELGVDRRNTKVPPEILRRAFELSPPVAESSVADFMMAPNGDVIFVELQRVAAGEYQSLKDDERKQLQQTVGGESVSLINDEFQRALRERAKIAVR